MRHGINKKTFAQIYERGGKLCVNLKCDPVEADFLRSAFADVTLGYHMNKTHWNTVTIGGDVTDDELRRQIEHSYKLIQPKAKKAKRINKMANYDDELKELEELERQADKIREVNKVHLSEFEKWLVDKSLTKKTIENHVDNVEFYINMYLLRYEIQDVTDGCFQGNLDGFLGDYFIRKCTWASCAHIKGNAASFKKFYTFMFEKGVIKQSDYDELCESIKLDMPEWLATMKQVEAAELD
jgi:predicted DNA-binding protein (MmcQ/YjbR family)